ncbi:hypothetical protein [Azoarcus sp. CIB]|uniref:hypothetical protein n=1 Tax=Aromatoleum sp. (strain CIB) TaxID=198107 RepID=UPI0012ED9F03|nr:hypothetical protein [Azoarcus sp. CIB]
MSISRRSATENPFQRPAFVKRVQKMGEKLGQPELFEQWLTAAQNDHIFSIMNLKDYGLVPQTTAELMKWANEYAGGIEETKLRNRLQRGCHF